MFGIRGGILEMSEDVKKPVIDGIEIDTEKAERMIKKIIIREKKNLSTRECSSPAMVKEIKKIIEEDVECY